MHRSARAARLAHGATVPRHRAERSDGTGSDKETAGQEPRGVGRHGQHDDGCRLLSLAGRDTAGRVARGATAALHRRLIVSIHARVGTAALLGLLQEPTGQGNRIQSIWARSVTLDCPGRPGTAFRRSHLPLGSAPTNVSFEVQGPEGACTTAYLCRLWLLPRWAKPPRINTKLP